MEAAEAELEETTSLAADIYGEHKEGERSDGHLFVVLKAYYYTKAARDCAAARVAILQGRFDPSLIDETSALM